MRSQTILAILIAAAFGLSLLMSRLRSRRGGFIDPASPQWRAAREKAQATIPLLRELHAASRGPILVKYAIRAGNGQTEHVWGELRHIDGSTFHASLETPLMGGNPRTAPPFELPLSSLEDWQVEIPDGSIRGGFTTQAEIALARQAGRSVPPHIASMETRFVDRYPVDEPEG